MSRLILCASGALLCIASGARAETQATVELPEKVDSHQTPAPVGLTGDWGGLRTRLHDDGVDVAASYVAETGWNFSGGKRHDVTEAGQFALGITVDADRLVGWEGATFRGTVTYRNGHDLGQRAGLGVLQQVQEIYGRGQTWRVTQFSYEQNFAGDAVSLKLGRATVGEDFASFSCYFMNLTFCGSQPGNVAGDYWYNWPVSQWMARLRVKHKDVYVQAAVYEVNPGNLEKDFTVGKLHGATGYLVPVELGWTPKVGRKGLAGSYKVGGWYSSANGKDVLLDYQRNPRAVTGLAPLNRSSRYGVWVNFWQQVSGTAENGKPISGVALFFNMTQTDRRTEITDNQIAAGVFWRSPFRSLPNDALAFAVGRTNVNGRYARSQRLDPERPRRLTAEYAAEFYYSAHPISWLELRPNIQYVHNPGGDRDAHDVAVLGLKGAVTF